MNPQTGIGRLVNSIADSLRLDQPQSKFLVATSEDLLSFHHKIKFLLNFRKVFALAQKVDLIHVFDTYPYGFLAVLVGRLTNKPVILTAVGTGSIKGLRSFPTSFLMKYTLKKSSRITAISHFVKNEILAVWPELKIEVICPGVSANESRLTNDNYSEQFADKDYILSVGSFKRRKGYDVSIKIFKSLLEKHPNLYYVIVANPDKSNEYYGDIEKLIQDHDLVGRVIIVNNLSDNQLQTIYRGAKLFILLSRNDNQDIEGFGLVFLEAAATGTPVIGCLGTGAEDAILDKVNGYLVDINDEEDIIKKANNILSDEALASNFSQGSLSLADKMSWENKIKDYVQIYSQFQS
jgi:phosphatidylinositol alpha-1,6-mannosyltransferase